MIDAPQPVSPLAGLAPGSAATRAPAKDPGLVLRSMPFYGKYLLKGRSGDGAFLSACRQALGVSLPIRPLSPADARLVKPEDAAAAADLRLLFQTAPESWMLVVRPGEREATAAGLEQAFSPPMAPAPLRGGWVDMSAGLHLLAVEGAQAASLIACGCPLDLAENSFPVGSAARSQFGPYTVTLVRRPQGFRLLVGRSYAQSFVEYLLELGAGFPILFEENRPL